MRGVIELVLIRQGLIVLVLRKETLHLGVGLEESGLTLHGKLIARVLAQEIKCRRVVSCHPEPGQLVEIVRHPGHPVLSHPSNGEILLRLVWHLILQRSSEQGIVCQLPTMEKRG